MIVQLFLRQKKEIKKYFRKKQKNTCKYKYFMLLYSAVCNLCDILGYGVKHNERRNTSELSGRSYQMCLR